MVCLVSLVCSLLLWLISRLFLCRFSFFLVVRLKNLILLCRLILLLFICVFSVCVVFLMI